MRKAISSMVLCMLVCGALISPTLLTQGRSMKRPSDDDPASKVSSEDMKKDYDAMMAMYNELKAKAEEFHKKYGMLPRELMPLIMGKPGITVPGQRGGQDGATEPGMRQTEMKKDVFKWKPTEEKKDVFE